MDLVLDSFCFRFGVNSQRRQFSLSDLVMTFVGINSMFSSGKVRDEEIVVADFMEIIKFICRHCVPSFLRGGQIFVPSEA